MFTVGHGAREIGMFLAILREAGVTVLVDVRRYPSSRHHPQFNRPALATALAQAGIGYEWQGEKLGGRRSRVPGSRHTALRNEALAGYAEHMDTPEFRTGVVALAERARTERVAVMCAETLWWHCHRMLVADALTMRGVKVVHLRDLGRRETHRPHTTVRRGADGWPVYDAQDTLPGL